MRGNVWTDDGVILLRKLWAEGATAAAIGRRLGGFSRSAVLGKVFRLRLNGEADTAWSDRAGPERTRRPGQAAEAAAAQTRGCAAAKGARPLYVVRPE